MSRKPYEKGHRTMAQRLTRPMVDAVEFRHVTYREADGLRTVVNDPHPSADAHELGIGYSHRLAGAHADVASGFKHCRECGDQVRKFTPVISFLFSPDRDPKTGEGTSRLVSAIIHLEPCPTPRSE